MAIILPHDVLLHRILPRLPLKSISLLMCVSKEFHSLLSSNTFKECYNHHRSKYHQNQEKFLALMDDHKEQRTLGTIDCEAPDNVLRIRSFKLPVAAKKVKFLASFDGLVCVGIKTNQSYRDSLIIWNPLTSNFKRLPEPKYHQGSAFGMFYSSCQDDYKIVSVSQTDVGIYSLKSNSWRIIAFKGTKNLSIYGFTQCTCLNENLYFINDHRIYSVVKFDTKTETFTEMKTSDSNHFKFRHRSTLIVKNGCIYVCVVYDVGRNGVSEIEVWKINEEGDWMKMGTYRVDPSNNIGSMKPIHLTKNGSLLMLGYKYAHSFYSFHSSYNCEGFLYKVDLKKKHIKVKDKDKETLCNNIEISQVVRYTETVVSPNRYIKK